MCVCLCLDSFKWAYVDCFLFVNMYIHVYKKMCIPVSCLRTVFMCSVCVLYVLKALNSSKNIPFALPPPLQDFPLHKGCHIHHTLYTV